MLAGAADALLGVCADEPRGSEARVGAAEALSTLLAASGHSPRSVADHLLASGDASSDDEASDDGSEYIL